MDDPPRLPSSPDWVRAAWKQTREELGSFVRTALAFTFHPRRFTRAWLDGTREALNPFGFAATAIGVIGTIRAASGVVEHEDGGGAGLASQIAGSILPSLYFACLGVLAHLAFRVLGSRRRLRDSVAVSLYAAGPAVLTQAFDSASASLYFLLFGHSINDELRLTFPVVVVSFVVTIVPFVLALREAHDAGRFPLARALTAFAAALFSSAVFFGLVRPPGSYGIHPTLAFRWKDRSLDYAFHIGD